MVTSIMAFLLRSLRQQLSGEDKGGSYGNGPPWFWSSLCPLVQVSRACPGFSLVICKVGEPCLSPEALAQVRWEDAAGRPQRLISGCRESRG